MKNSSLLFLFGFCLLLSASCVKEPQPVKVSGISINPTSITLTEGETSDLVATVSPSDADNQKVIWASNDGSVVTVNNGRITAVNPGSTTVTAKSDDGGFTATCSVTVIARIIEVASVSLSKTELSLTEGDSATITATVTPDNATDKTVTWSSSDPGVATVDGGKVTAIREGTATVTARAGDKTATCMVSVARRVIPVESVELDRSELSLVEGDSYTLTATVHPSDATDKTITWTSSNPDVASVDGGVVSANKEGSATITAKAGDKTATCRLSVARRVIPVESVELDRNELSLVEGDSYTLTATVHPDEATDKTITWTSSNPDVASVDGGVVSARKEGSVTITAKAGNKTAMCSVVVERKVIPVERIELDRSGITIAEGQSATLVATVYPEDATDKTVSWSSSDSGIASVKDGLVTAVKGGTAKITAMASNGISASCTVTVTVPVKGIRISPDVLTLEQYTSGVITATVIPSNATEKGVTWKTSDPSIATVSNGTVYAVSPGVAAITATTVDGSYSASCAVKVEPERTKAKSLSFAAPALFVSSGESYSLGVSVTPEDAVCEFSWRSSSSAVSVSGTGDKATVKPAYLSTGYSTVTVTDKRTGLSASIKVYSFIDGFSWNESSGEEYAGYPLITIANGGTHQLRYTCNAGSQVLNLFSNPENFVFYEPTYVVSEPSNISISPDGLVTGIKDGTTGIKTTGLVSGSGNRIYIRVASKVNESEYNDSSDYANVVPYGLPMMFSLQNRSDVDWFELMPAPNSSGNVSVTISVEYTDYSSLGENEGRLCKYSLYDSSMRLWGSGSFSFSGTSGTASTTRTVPSGPLYLKVYFDSSYNSGLCPLGNMVLRMTVN
jgi:uncharacterized protein YjdB